MSVVSWVAAGVLLLTALVARVTLESDAAPAAVDLRDSTGDVKSDVAAVGADRTA